MVPRRLCFVALGARMLVLKSFAGRLSLPLLLVLSPIFVIAIGMYCYY